MFSQNQNIRQFGHVILEDIVQTFSQIDTKEELVHLIIRSLSASK